MAVYPFYISTDADGRVTPIAGGTRRKDGDMTTIISQRDDGSITEPYRIRQYSTYNNDGHQLVTDVYYLGEVISSHITNY